MAAGDVFEGDPSNGSGNVFLSSGGVIDTGLTGGFSGRFDIRNGVLVDVLNGTPVVSLGQAGPALIQELPGGVFGVASSIDVAGVNRGASENWFRSISGTIDVQTPLGNTIQFTIDTAMVNHAGHQTVVQQDENGNLHFSSIRGPYNSTRELQALVDPNLMLATPEQTVANTIRWNLWTYQQEELRELARQFNQFTSTGEPDVSGVLNTLFEMPDLTNITAQTNYLFGP